MVKGEENRRLVYLFFAVLDYLREINDELDLYYPEGKESGKIMKSTKERVEIIPHAIRVAEPVQFFRDRGLTAVAEWEETATFVAKGGYCVELLDHKAYI